ncbi:MAG: hypothetical protein V7K25_16705 [Nostoc sp.]|uniref:hypothetical protein n=1 Tax=Nostoc sp. TaxID=1180 RepID=UPI002FF986C3
MENLEKVNLESKRLILQTISLEHTEDVFQEFTSEITTFMYPKPAQSLSETEKIIRDMILQRENHTNLVLVILKKEHLKFLGICEVGAIDTQGLPRNKLFQETNHRDKAARSWGFPP